MLWRLWLKRTTQTQREQIFMEGFSQGFKLAWSTMLPYVQQSIQQGLLKVKEQTLEEALTRLEPEVLTRLERAKQVHLRPQAELLAKQRQFEHKLRETKDSRYGYYLEALAWALNGSHGEDG